MLKVKNYRLILYCLTAILAAACQTVLPSAPPRSTFNLEFQQRQPGNRQMEWFLLKELKEKIQRRGYTYNYNPMLARWNLLITYQYQRIPPNKVLLDVRLSLYDPKTRNAVWTESASATALRQDGMDKLIGPISWTLTNRMPYAPDFGCVGIVLSRDLRIITFNDHSPAQAAGLKKNDQIIGIDQQMELDYDKCQHLLCGRIGTKVEIMVLRDDKEQTFKVTRVSMASMDSSETTPPVKIQPLSIEQLKKKLADP